MSILKEGRSHEKDTLRTIALLVTLAASASAVTLSGENEYPITTEPAELSVWTVLPASIEDLETNGMTAYFVEITGVHINWTQIASDDSTMLTLSIASGVYPDIYCKPLTTDQVTLYSQAGIFLPLDDLIEEHGYNIKKAFKADPSLKEALISTDGHIYTLFRTDPATYLLIYEKLFLQWDWVDAYMEATGSGEPQTIDELKDMLVYWRDNDMNKNGDPFDEYPLMSSQGGKYLIHYLMNAFEAVSSSYMMVNDNITVRFTDNTDAWREGLKCVRDFYEEGLIAEETFI